MRPVLAFFLIFSFIFCAAQKNPSKGNQSAVTTGKNAIPKPSATKLIKLHLKSTEEKVLSFMGNKIEEIIIYGTEVNVMAFVYHYNSLMIFCGCGLISRAECIKRLESLKWLSRPATNPGTLTKIKVEFPKPGDFNNVYRSITQANPNTCEAKSCLEICSHQESPEVCLNINCESEIELCYNGEYTLSISNGAVSVEAKL